VGEICPNRVLLVFDRPVRSIELSKDESLQVAFLLTSNINLKKKATKKDKKQKKALPKVAAENVGIGR
jgi:hypothetical protein